MDGLRKNKTYLFLFWLFIVVSIVHVFYAAFVNRGMYYDGTFYMLLRLDLFSRGIYNIIFDPEHPRMMVSALMQLPVIIFHKFLFIRNKDILMSVYSCTQFLLPFLALIWNYNLSKRTGRIDVLFWSMFSYGAIICTYMIYSVTESIMGVMFHFILWNYLVAEIDYKKRDFVFVIFLIIVMFGTYEYVAYLGIIYFIAHMHYMFYKKDLPLKSMIMKSLIGFGSLTAAIFNIIYMLRIPNETGEIARFFREACDYIPHVFELNSLFSIITVILLIFFIFKKEKMGYITLSIVFLIYMLVFVRLFSTPTLSVYPMWEGHLRSIPCWAMPLIFISLYIQDLFKKPDSIKFTNYIIIALICCIFQSCWQVVESYYWDKNIKYIKSELAKTDDILYIPSEHKETISDFHTDTLRRFIWHSMYAGTSIIFSDSYEIKTLLVNYDEVQDPGNGTFRNKLYVLKKFKKISIPFGVFVNIKNDFWDMTKCADALDKYNKEHNIKTDR